MAFGLKKIGKESGIEWIIVDSISLNGKEYKSGKILVQSDFDFGTGLFFSIEIVPGNVQYYYYSGPYRITFKQ